MRLWQDGLIALLAAIGLASILWMIVRAALLAPARPCATALISARGSGEDLEEQVMALSLLYLERDAPGEILLVDCGLTEEGKTLCRHLARQYRRLTLIVPEDIPKYVT